MAVGDRSASSPVPSREVRRCRWKVPPSDHVLGSSGNCPILRCLQKSLVHKHLSSRPRRKFRGFQELTPAGRRAEPLLLSRKWCHSGSYRTCQANSHPTALDLEFAAARVSPFGDRGPSPPHPGLGVRGLGEALVSAGRSGRAELTGRPVLRFLEPAGSMGRAFRLRSQLRPRPRALCPMQSGGGPALPKHPGSLCGAHPAAPQALAITGSRLGCPWGSDHWEGRLHHIPLAPQTHASAKSGYSKRKIRKWGCALLSSPRGVFFCLPVLSPSFCFLNWQSQKQFWKLDVSEQKRFASQKQSAPPSGLTPARRKSLPWLRRAADGLGRWLERTGQCVASKGPGP